MAHNMRCTGLQNTLKQTKMFTSKRTGVAKRTLPKDETSCKPIHDNWNEQQCILPSCSVVFG